MKKARVHLSNGEVADLYLGFTNVQDWVEDITATKGIRTSESYFPFHSIVYILFEDVTSEAGGEPEIEVELEQQLVNGE